MSKPKFKLPAYRKGQTVRTPKGVGPITSIDQTRFGFMYCVGGLFYHEEELKAI